jgi:hypothetical protein
VVDDVRAILDLPTNSVAAPANDAASNQPKVLWKENSNTLFVVATRTQQMWVEGYLATRDRH